MPYIVWTHWIVYMIQEQTKQWKSSSFNFRSWLHLRRYRPALGMWPPWWWTYLQVPRHCCGSTSCSPFTYQIFLRTTKHDERIDFISYWILNDLGILANDTQHPHSLNKHIHLSELSLLPPCQVHWKCIWMVKCISMFGIQVPCRWSFVKRDPSDPGNERAAHLDA